jgi:hypothetical protein
MKVKLLFYTFCAFTLACLAECSRRPQYSSGDNADLSRSNLRSVSNNATSASPTNSTRGEIFYSNQDLHIKTSLGGRVFVNDIDISSLAAALILQGNALQSLQSKYDALELKIASLTDRLNSMEERSNATQSIIEDLVSSNSSLSSSMVMLQSTLSISLADFQSNMTFQATSLSSIELKLALQNTTNKMVSSSLIQIQASDAWQNNTMLALSNTFNSGVLFQTQSINNIELQLTNQSTSINQLYSNISNIASVPSGTISYFGSLNVPLGWLICDGRAVSRTTYRKLFLYIGTTFGTGDGSMTFNLPDLRGEFIRGADLSRGVDPGRVLGSWQPATGVYNDYSYGTNPDNEINIINGDGSTRNFVQALRVAFTQVSSQRTWTYVRPRNVALVAYIKF